MGEGREERGRRQRAGGTPCDKQVSQINLILSSSPEI